MRDPPGSADRSLGAHTRAPEPDKEKSAHSGLPDRGRNDVETEIGGRRRREGAAQSAAARAR